MSHLSLGCINLAQLREHHRRELLKCLSNIPGSKILVWDESLMAPLNLIIESSAIMEHEVEKMIVNSGVPISGHDKSLNVVFLVRPTIAQMDIVAGCILSTDINSALRKRLSYHIIFVPRQTSFCLKKLRDKEVNLERIASMQDFRLDFIPFDADLVSMEIECIKECLIEEDHSSLFYVAKALMTLQALYGVIGNIVGKGELSQRVVDMMVHMRRELAGTEQQVTPQIDELIIIDRSVDFVTPMLTQLTYEGLIDESFGLAYTSVKLPAEKFASSEGKQQQQAKPITPGQMKTLTLNSTDNLFTELRDKNFNAVGPVLTKRAKSMSAQFDERHKATSVSEMKQFVSRLPQLQADKASLAMHTTIAELVKAATDSDDFMGALRSQQSIIGQHTDIDKPVPYIEDLIAKQEPLIKVLRLICLQCQCNGGFKQKVYDTYKRDIIQAYGYQHMLTLQNLEAVGMLKVQGARNSFAVVRKSLKLIVDDVNEQTPNDMSYTYSGYAPLSVRLLEKHQVSGWRSIGELLNALPGPTIRETQSVPQSALKRRGSKGSIHSQASEPVVRLVLFVGGVTMAEIAAIRFLAIPQDDGGQSDYIIATTKLINGTTLLQSLSETLNVTVDNNPFANS